MSLFRHKVYLAATLGHFTVDTFTSTGPVLVTFLSIPMGLSAARIGLAIAAYQFLAAFTQPLFGWMADKTGSRLLGSISLPWTIGFLTLSIFVAQTTNNYWLFLTLFSIAAIGSGAFHPQGAMHAATTITSRAATATAIFFLFGQGGLASGPILAGLILDNLDIKGMYLLSLASLPVLAFMVYAMRDALPPHPAGARESGGPRTKASVLRAVPWGSVIVLALVIGLRSWTFLGTVSFLPKIFQEMGWTATSYGLITGAYWLASALAGVVVGHIADRWGRRYVVFATLLLGSLPVYFLPISDGWLAFPLAIIIGGLLGGSNSIYIVIAQALLPGRKALASGVTMGYMFGVGALSVWGIGALADVWGLTPVIQAGTAIGVLSALLALLLPTTRQTTQIPLEQSEHATT